MKCPHCGQSLANAKGEPLILCASCVSLGSREALLEMQRHFLPKVVTQDYPWLRLMRHDGREEWHIELLGPCPGQAFCGVVFAKPDKGRSPWKGKRVPHSLLINEHLCQDCHRTLKRETAALAPEAA